MRCDFRPHLRGRVNEEIGVSVDFAQIRRFAAEVLPALQAYRVMRGPPAKEVSG
jgi:hypothetical protein